MRKVWGHACELFLRLATYDETGMHSDPCRLALYNSISKAKILVSSNSFLNAFLGSNFLRKGVLLLEKSGRKGVNFRGRHARIPWGLHATATQIGPFVPIRFSSML